MGKLSISLLALAAFAPGIDAFSTLGSFTPSSTLNGVKSSSSLKMSLEKYSSELKETAAKLTRPGYGLLACDESTGTVGARLESIGVENIEENRAEWRSLLFTAEGLGNYISGAILFEETLYQTAPSGEKMVDILNGQGIIPGIKVDTGLKPLCGADGENW